jgi:hypothetical protein
MRVHFQNTGNHLNISIDNLYSVYCLSLDKTDETRHNIEHVTVREINPVELKTKIKVFEQTFHIDELRPKGKNKANTSSTTNMNKPVAYQPKNTMTSNFKNPNTNPSPRQPASAQVVAPSSNITTNSRVLVINSSNNTNAKNPATESSQKRNFVFKPTNQKNTTSEPSETVTNTTSSESQAYSEGKIERNYFLFYWMITYRFV